MSQAGEEPENLARNSGDSNQSGALKDEMPQEPLREWPVE